MNTKLTPLQAMQILKQDIGKCYEDEMVIVEKALKEYELMKEIRITARFDLAQVNKEHKALEIIKRYVQLEGDKVYTTGWEWNLTPEEYDLLKEVLL